MAKVRFKVTLNKGRTGVPLHKLAKVAEECDKFLRLLGEDIKLESNKGQWLAKDFENGSVTYVNEFVGAEITDNNEKDFYYALNTITSHSPDRWNGNIRRKTYIQYTKLAEPLDPDEGIELGIYQGGSDRPELRELTKQKAIELFEAIEDKIQYYGAIQGKVHSLIKGVTPPYFKVRDLISKDLINCYFKIDLYDKVMALLKNKDAIVNVSGLITASRAEKLIESISVESADKINISEEYLPGDLDKFFGCAPDMIGDLKLQDYINKVRGRE